MEKSDKLYRFRSKSQHMLIVSVLGRRQKIKFSTPYGGVSRYNTSNEIIARQIRNSQAFKSGTIVEDDAIAHLPVVNVNDNVNDNQSEKKNKKDKQTPEYLKTSVKVKPKNDNDNVNDNVNDNEQSDDAAANPTTDVVGTEAEGTAATEGAGAKVVQDELFQMSLEDVETYMDAKQYVNDVLHAELIRKEEVKAYCEEHNVKFPHFSFD